LFLYDLRLVPTSASAPFSFALMTPRDKLGGSYKTWFLCFVSVCDVGCSTYPFWNAPPALLIDVNGWENCCLSVVGEISYPHQPSYPHQERFCAPNAVSISSGGVGVRCLLVVGVAWYLLPKGFLRPLMTARSSRLGNCNFLPMVLSINSLKRHMLCSACTKRDAACFLAVAANEK